MMIMMIILYYIILYYEIIIIIIKRIIKINCYDYYTQRCLCYVIILSTNSCKLTKNYIKRLIKGLNKNRRVVHFNFLSLCTILFFNSLWDSMLRYEK